MTNEELEELKELEAKRAHHEAITRGLRLMLRRQRRENMIARVNLGWLHIQVCWLKVRHAVGEWVGL